MIWPAILAIAWISSFIASIALTAKIHPKSFGLGRMHIFGIWISLIIYVVSTIILMILHFLDMQQRYR